MGKKSLLTEVFKISIEVDGDGMTSSPSVVQAPQAESAPAHRNESISLQESGYFGKYVEELSRGSMAYHVLKETAREVNIMLTNSLDDLALREDKKEYNAGISKANENVLRSWRAFIRELAQFEKRFG